MTEAMYAAAIGRWAPTLRAEPLAVLGWIALHARQPTRACREAIYDHGEEHMLAAVPHINSRGEERTDVGRRSALYAALASLESAGALRRVRRSRAGHTAAYVITFTHDADATPAWVQDTIDELLPTHTPALADSGARMTPWAATT